MRFFRVWLEHSVRVCLRDFVVGWCLEFKRLQGVVRFLSLAFSILAFISFYFDAWEDCFEFYGRERFGAFHCSSRRCMSKFLFEVRRFFRFLKAIWPRGWKRKGSSLNEVLLKSVKEAADNKYKGNRKQLEVNLRLDNILTQTDESVEGTADH